MDTMDEMVKALAEELTEMLSEKAPDFGTCEICGGPLDLEHLCLDPDCPNYN